MTKVCAVGSLPCAPQPSGNPLSAKSEDYAILLVLRNGQVQTISPGDRIDRKLLGALKLELMEDTEGAVLVVDGNAISLAPILNPLLLRIVDLEQRVTALEA